MKARNIKVLSPEERRQGAAVILALAVRRILRDAQNSEDLNTDISNRVELVLERRLSVSLVPDGSGPSIE
jgi:hypothetical protein